MQKIAKRTLLLLAGMTLSCAFGTAFAYTDCYRECMDVHSCGSSMDSSYCSSVQARCASDCRDKGPGGRAKSYGAIAYSKRNGAYGYSHGWTNQKKAEKVAVRNCLENGRGCKSVVWFYNSCGAVASDGRHVTWGQADTTRAATQQALDKCNKSLFKGKCEGVISHCSG